MSSQYHVHKGSAAPLGASRKGALTNFSLFSQHATSVTLCLFSPDAAHPFLSINLDPKSNRSADIWHIAIEGLPERILYAYKVDGPSDPAKGLIYDKKRFVSDPYAKGLGSSHVWSDSFAHEEIYEPKGKLISSSNFDWQGISPPNIPQENLIIYEMHVRGFTQHKSSNTKYPGTFLGIIEKIPYLKSLGINAIELLPIFEFNECENKLKNPKTQKRLHNFWGYSTVNFFCPMNRFAASNEWQASIDEFKTLVRELHRNQIEVILDVVYNHTAEGGKTGPYLSFKGIDNSVYYLLGPDGDYLNFSGTGNTFNCNHPVVRRLIVDSLKYWVKEMHVDGFRFDLASVLTRGLDGTPLSDPPLIDEILSEPGLANTKWIAEAWDAAGLYQVGSFPGQGEWYEWNGKYRDVVRRFIKGTDGQAGAFASAICGSQDLYGSDRGPYHSINFVTAHDGYSLKDLVSYQDKHNEGNAEENRDGANDNESWNCGVEGETQNRKILHLREVQMKNFLLTLFFSIGTPMILMGDEYGHTRKGNNNPYCQDNELNWFLWDELQKNQSLHQFCRSLIHFRTKYSHFFCRKQFLTSSDIIWHGHKANTPSWDHGSRFIAYTLIDPKGHDLYIAFNAHYEEAHIELPQRKDKKHWYKMIDTSLPAPQHFVESPEKGHPEKFSHKMPPYSALVLQAF